MNFLKLTSVHKSSKYPEFYPDICYTGNNESFKELYQQNSNVKLLSVDIFDYDFRAAQDPQFISICSESFLFLTNDSNFDLDFLKDNFTIIPCNRKTEKLLNIEHPRIRNIENDIENNLNLFIRNFEAFQLCANSIYTFYIQRHYYSDDYFSHPQDFYSFFEERIEATIFHPNYERNISNSERNTSDDFSSLYSDLIGYYNKPEIEYELIKFDRKDFIFLKKLNEGGFASVNLCFHRPSGLIFAVKNFFGSNKSSVKQYKRELKFFTSHRHPFIVRCFGFIDGEESLVLEFLSNGDLNHYMESNSDDNYTLRLSPTQKTLILIRTLYAIDFLHSRGFIHRDIKGENIVIDRNGNSLLIDMNIVISYLDKIYYSNYDTKYSSPEMKNTIEYSFQTDIYSFGLLIFELGTFNLSSIQENEIKSLLESEFGDIYKIYDFCTQEISNKNFFFRINSTAVLWNIKSDQSYFKGSDYEFINKCFKEYDELITKNEHLSIEWYQRPDIDLLLARINKKGKLKQILVECSVNSNLCIPIDELIAIFVYSQLSIFYDIKDDTELIEETVNNIINRIHHIKYYSKPEFSKFQKFFTFRWISEFIIHSDRMKPSRSFGGIVDTYQKYLAILQHGLAYKFGSNMLGIAEVNRATLFVFTLWTQIKAVKRKNSWRNYSNMFSLFQVLENNLETLFDLFYALNNNIDNVKLLNPSFYKSVILLLSLVKALRKKTINKNDFPNDDSNKQNKEEHNQEGYNQEEYNQDEYNYWNRNSHKNQFSQDFFSELKELNDVNSLTFTGIIYERDGKIEEAIDCYNRAIKLKQKLGNNTNDDDYEAKVRLLNILTMRKEFDKIEIKEIQFFEEIYTKFKEVKHPEAMGDQISSMKYFNLPIIENILNEFEFHLGFNE